MADDERDDLSPWASDAIDPPAPIEFVFTSSDPADPPPGIDAEATVDTWSASRRWRTIAAVTIAVAAIAAVGAVWSTNNSDTDLTPDTPADTVDLDELPSLPEVSERDADDRDTPDDPTVTPTSTVEEVVRDPFEDFDDIIPEYSAAASVWTQDAIPVLDELSNVAEMTVVVRTQNALTEIDFPSGVTRSFPLSGSFNFDDVAVGRSATFVPGNPSFGARERTDPSARLLVAGQPPVPIEGDAFDSLSMRSRPGTDRFSGAGFESDFETAKLLDVAPDGSVTLAPLELDNAQTLASIGLFTPNGNPIVVDGGAVFEITADGPARLIGRGELVASSSHHLLIRSCDDTFACGGELFDFRDGSRRSVRLDESYTSPFNNSAPQISPDGSLLLVPPLLFNGDTRVVDLSTGEVRALSQPSFSTSVITSTNHAWAADSSGFFQITNGTLEFYDLTNDVVTGIRGVAGVVSYGVRLDLSGVPPPADIADGSTGLRIRGADRIGTIYDIDLDTGEVIRFRGPNPLPPLGSSRLVIGFGDGPTLLTSSSAGGALRLDADAASSVQIDQDIDTIVVPGPAGSAWRQARDDGRVFRLFDSSGSDLPPTIGVPDGLTVVGGDAAGNLLAVSDDGAATVLTADAAELVTEGELLGIGTTSAIVRECDDADCVTSRLDRATGIATPVTVPPELAVQQAMRSATGAIVENTVSPDGQVLIAPNGEAKWTITDLGAGERSVTAAPTLMENVAVAWSSDSQFAVLLARDGLVLYDRRNASVNLLPDAPPLTTIAAL